MRRRSGQVTWPIRYLRVTTATGRCDWKTAVPRSRVRQALPGTACRSVTATRAARSILLLQHRQRRARVPHCWRAGNAKRGSHCTGPNNLLESMFGQGEKRKQQRSQIQKGPTVGSTKHLHRGSEVEAGRQAGTIGTWWLPAAGRRNPTDLLRLRDVHVHHTPRHSWTSLPAHGHARLTGWESADNPAAVAWAAACAGCKGRGQRG